MVQLGFEFLILIFERSMTVSAFAFLRNCCFEAEKPNRLLMFKPTCVCSTTFENHFSLIACIQIVLLVANNDS